MSTIAGPSNAFPFGGIASLLLFLLSTLSSSSAIPPRLNTWEPVGLSGGGAMFAPAISPRDPQQMMINCDMSAAYLSSDGGRNWWMLPYAQLRGNTRCRPAFHPTDARTIYAASGWYGLKVTRDGGQTWQPLGELPGADPQGEIAIDPGELDLMLVGSGQSVCRSTDGGQTWVKCVGPHGPALAFHFDQTSPAVKRICFAGTTEGVWRSEDAGVTWAEATGGLPSKNLLAFAGGSNAESNRVLLYCSLPSRLEDGRLAGGIYRSTDRGVSWEAVPGAGLNRETKAADEWAEGPIANYKFLLTSNAKPEMVYAFNTSTGIPPPHNASVYRSDDAGATWRATFQADPRFPGCNVQQDYTVATDHQSYSASPLAVAISAGDPDHVMALNEGQCFLTADGGKTWTPGHTRIAPGFDAEHPPRDARWICNGLVVTSAWNFYVDPFHSEHNYICYTDMGFARSTDHGATWQWWARAGRAPWRNTCYELAFDPTTAGKIWGAFSDVHDIPNANIIEGRHAGKGPGGVCLSTDFAATWTKSNGGLPLAPVVSVVVDPKSPEGARVLYAGLFGEGVWKSVDDGTTWKSASLGLGAPSNQRACRVMIHADGTLFALVTANRMNGKFAPDGVGLYRSTDGAATWKRINETQPLLWPKDYAVDPADSRKIYLAAGDAKQEKQGGLYRTKDGGATWERIARKGPEHFGVWLHPAHPGWIYLTLCEDAPGSGLWLSQDDGATWAPMDGLPFCNIMRITVDAADPENIYATTFGGSVWHGPATPSAIPSRTEKPAVSPEKAN